MGGINLLSLLTRKFGKCYDELSNEQKAMICNASYDCSIGRYSKFLMWSLDEISEFFKYCEEVGVNYFESSDTERWALEDSFDMS